jgi:tetratricopeptide (TPR) repeat protein
VSPFYRVAVLVTFGAVVTVEQLLKRGLDYYGSGLLDDAIECWRAVLAITPEEPRALEYLEAVGASPVTVQASERANGRHDTQRINTLVGELARTARSDAQLADALERVRERRYEEALALLYEAHRVDPHNTEVSRSIGVIKDRLITDYRRELGAPTAVPMVVASTDLSADERDVAALVDGVLCVEDIVEISLLGALRTYRALITLLRREMLLFKESSVARATIRDSRGETVVAKPPSVAAEPLVPKPTPAAVVEPAARERPLEPAPVRPSYVAQLSAATQAYLRGQLSEARVLLASIAIEIPADDLMTRRAFDRLLERVEKGQL